MQQAGRPADAAKLYSQVLDANPPVTSRRCTSLPICISAKEATTQRSACSRKRRGSISSSWTFIARGCALQRLGRHEAAVFAYDMALALAPTDVEAWSNRGVALTEIKRFPEALASFDPRARAQARPM